MVTANGKPAVLLNVNRQPESNTLQVANEVHALITNLRRDSSRRTPRAVLRPIDNRSRFDRQRSRCRAHRNRAVFDHSGAFPAGLGTSLVAGLVIPVTLMITFIVLRFTGQDFQPDDLGDLPRLSAGHR